MSEKFQFCNEVINIQMLFSHLRFRSILFFFWFYSQTSSSASSSSSQLFPLKHSETERKSDFSLNRDEEHHRTAYNTLK